ncbi:MAG TPA: aminotransferase class III-fold pyridoxal phosphate-dependent enzyme [Thermoflexia bacterium]|jgi:4-aminobutyrate aminotransferase|nr:aminotransferase class III-fold pyridoxal phosphate-dependent enzyme [Thermoflexia bacterium]
MSDWSDLIPHVSPVWTHLLDKVLVRGEGPYVWDQDGRRYLDFTSGIGVVNTGHCHPRVVEAIREQAGRALHLQANIGFVHEPMLRLIGALKGVVPPELDTFFFSNSGAEAVEAAVKLARQATGRPNIIAFQRAFHGRTVGTMSLTSSKTIYRAMYQPLMAGVFFAPYAYCYRCPKMEANPERYGSNCRCDWPLEQVRFLLKSQTAPEETAAILVEPVLGEGGYVVPPAAFLRGLREICDEYGILLILDEVQSGFGRTGRFFALEHFGVVPDILVMAKGLASGLPLSGIAARRELMERWEPGSHGGTYGGNVVACAAAEATIRVLLEEGLVENAARLGEILLDRLRALQARYPGLGDVRGLGLMVGVEFVVPGGRTPDKDRAKEVQKGCRDNGLLLLTCGTEENVIRWIPPLVITEQELETALEIFEAVLDSVVQ